MNTTLMSVNAPAQAQARRPEHSDQRQATATQAKQHYNLSFSPLKKYYTTGD